MNIIYFFLQTLPSFWVVWFTNAWLFRRIRRLPFWMHIWITNEFRCIRVLLCIGPDSLPCVLELRSAHFSHCLIFKKCLPLSALRKTHGSIFGRQTGCWQGLVRRCQVGKGDSHGLPQEETPELSRPAFMSFRQSKNCRANKLSERIDFSHFLTARWHCQVTLWYMDPIRGRNELAMHW